MNRAFRSAIALCSIVFVGNLFAQSWTPVNGTTLYTNSRVLIGYSSGITAPHSLDLCYPYGSDLGFYIWELNGSSAYQVFSVSDAGMGAMALKLKTSSGSDKITIGASPNYGSVISMKDLNGNYAIYLNASQNSYITGNLGIGTTNPGTYKLAVEGTIGAREIVVTTGAWADYVFKPGYNLKPLSEVENFIKINNHLEGIPTEKEVKTSGVAVGDMQTKLLQKVEELTLYVIEQNKKIEQLSKQNQELAKKIQN